MDILKALFGKAKNLLIGFAAVFVFWLILFLIMSLIPLPSVVLPASIVITLIITFFYLKKAFLIVEEKTAVATQFLGRDSRILTKGPHFIWFPLEKKVKKLGKYEINLMKKVFPKTYNDIICEDNVPLKFDMLIETQIHGTNKENLISNVRNFTYKTDNPDATLLFTIEGGIRSLARENGTWINLKSKDTMELSRMIENHLDEKFGQDVVCKILNIEPEDPTLLASYTAIEKAKKEKEVAKEKAEAKRIGEEEEIKAVEKTIKSLMEEFKITFKEALGIVRYQDNQGILNTFAENGNTLITQNPLQYVADLSGMIDLKKK